MTHHHDPAVAARSVARTGLRGVLIAGFAALVTNCSSPPKQEITASIPDDYRVRHPITMVEGRRTLEVFVGTGRGGLSPTQRAQVLAFAQTWRSEATAGVVIERPDGGPNERAARDTLKEVLSILTQAGIPNHGIGIRPYPAAGNRVAALRLNYPHVAAHAGPCGLWPENLGPGYETKHFENRPYYNLGCAHQRNLAAMVADPQDLVQPRAEGAVWQAKRTFGMEKWRKGESPTTVYPDSQKGAISEVGR
jgi:pilus assembly protein CpaD